MPTVAEQLRQAREAMNLDVHQVADVTKLKTDQIRALDEGNWDYFTAPVYLRGSIRTYANLLKLDAAKLIAELEAERGGPPDSATIGESAPLKHGAIDSLMLQLSRINWLIVGTLVVLVVIGFIANTSYRTWKARKAVDPLRTLTSGMYQPDPNAGELLPLPTNAPPPGR